MTTGIVHVPTSTISVDATALRNALSNPKAWNDAITAAVGQSVAALTVAGKIALFDVPRAAVTLSTLTGRRIYANDPGGTLPPDAALARIDLSAMLYVPGVLNALAAAGAVGAIGILDAQSSAGVMGLTGEPEVQIVTTWPNGPLVDASTAYAKLFPRTIVGEPPLIGEVRTFASCRSCRSSRCPNTCSSVTFPRSPPS